MEACATQHVSGWGRYPVEECAVFRPEKRRSVEAIVLSGAQPNFIARGLGRSYGDAATNDRDASLSSSRRGW